jgi:ketosteroid isomerase-like protein
MSGSSDATVSRATSKSELSGVQPINIDIIKAILESSNEAWNSGSVEGVLDKYVEDIVYTTNTFGPNGEPLTIRGKDNIRRRFQAGMDAIASHSRIESIRIVDGLVRTRLLVYMRHRQTGHELTIRLRQILRFEGFRVAEMQDFHDAARLAAFWRLVGDAMDQARKSDSVSTAPQVDIRHPKVKA